MFHISMLYAAKVVKISELTKSFPIHSTNSILIQVYSLYYRLLFSTLSTIILYIINYHSLYYQPLYISLLSDHLLLDFLRFFPCQLRRIYVTYT